MLLSRRLLAAAVFSLLSILAVTFSMKTGFASGIDHDMTAKTAGVPHPSMREAALAAGSKGSSGYAPSISATLLSDIEVKRWGGKAASAATTLSAARMFFTLPYHSGNISTVAGSGLGAGLLNARQMVVDLNGDLLVADAGGHRVVRIGNPGSATPTFTAVAGVGSQGYSGDGGQAANATFSAPAGVDIDLNGNIYIADSGNNAVRRVNGTTGVVTTIISASFGLNNPANIAVDSAGAVYVRDANKGITKWTPGSPATTVVLDPALANNVYSLTADKGDATNTIYFTSFGTNSGLIMKRANGGTGPTIKLAGNDGACNFGPPMPPNPCWTNGSATPPLTTRLDYSTVLSIQGGYLYFNSQLDNIMGRFKADGTGNLEKIAGNGDDVIGGTGDGQLAMNAGIGHYAIFSQGVTSDATPRIYISGNNASLNDTSRQKLRSFPLGGIINTVTIPSNPSFGGDGGPATDAVVGSALRRVAFDDTNRMFIADLSNARIRMVATNGTISSVAGTGVSGNTTVNVAPTSSQLDIKNIAADSAGFIYIATQDKKVVRFKPGQNLTLVVDLAAYAGIFDMVIMNDFIYVLMSGNDLNKVLRFSTAGALLETMYTNPSLLGFAAQSLGVGPDGSVYLSNAQGPMLGTLSVGKVTGPTTVTQIAPLTSISSLQANYPLVGNPNGGFTYMDNLQAKNYDPNDNSIAPVAGTAGVAGYGGDGGLASSSVLSSALGLGYDRNCNLHIADSGNQRVRKVQTLLNATVNTVPAGRSVTVDGVLGTGGLFQNWLSPSQHVLSTTSPQAGAAGVRYVFVKWSPSNNTGLTENVTASCSDPTYTANFKTQFLLTPVLGANVPAGSATLSPAVPTYVDEAPALANISTSSIGAGLRFNKWTVTAGTATVTSATSASTTAALTSPATLQANLAAVDGSGTMTVAPTVAAAGVAGQVFTFTYTAALGGMDNGEVDVVVPNGWTVPAAGNVNVSAGTKSFVGNTIKVTGVTLNQSQTLTVTFTATPAAGDSTFQTTQKSIVGGTLTALASSPSVHAIQAPAATNATTMVNLQTVSGLVVTRNATDNSYVTHFKISNIQNGSLFKNNGTTAINNNDFITVAEGLAGLKFTPALNSSAAGSFAAQASTDATGTVLSLSTSATITVLKYDTAATLVSDNNPSGNTQNVTFTATVTANNQPQAPPAGTVPTGTVQFMDGMTPIVCSNGNSSTQPVAANGEAQCQTSTLSVVGSPHSVTAVYSGDSSFNGATSGAVQQVVLPCFSDPVVTSPADDGPNTLREALANVCSAPTNKITFALQSPNNTITLTTGELVIGKDAIIENTIDGNSGAVTVTNAAGATNRIFRVAPGITATISGLNITGGNAATGPFPGTCGGGVMNDHGTLTILNSSIYGNSAAFGGGVCNMGRSGPAAVMTLKNSTISGNTVTSQGGGLHNDGVEAGGSATLSIVNATFSDNEAAAGSNGGAISNEAHNGGTTVLTIANSILQSTNGTGGTILYSGTTLPQSLGHNIVDDAGGHDPGSGFTVIFNHATDLVSTNPLIGPLADNGGLSRTHALLADSPASDAGDNAAAVGLTTDQRGAGNPRVVDSADADATAAVDIGAFEDYPTLADIGDQTTAEDTPVGVIFAVGDDSTGFSLGATSSNQALVPDGNLSFGGTGAMRTLTITPALNANTPANGTATITVTVTGINNQTVTDTFVLTVTPVDDAPAAIADAATVNEDSSANTVNVLANDTDIDGGSRSITSVTQPANGTVAVTNAGADLTYTPGLNYCNNPPGTTPDTFTYTITPGGTTATVSVTVTCVDDAPTGVDDARTVAEDSGPSAIDVLTNDTDVDGGTKLIDSVTQPANGTAAIFGGGTGLTYAPNGNYCNSPAGGAADTFTYTLNGGSTATVTMTVTCVDDNPVAVADAATVVEDSGANAVDVLGNDTDIDGGPKAVGSVTQPANGAVAITGGGTGLAYQPAPDYCNNPPGNSPDTFSYTLTPGGATTTVSVTVTCVDDPPVAVNDPVTVLEDSGVNAVNVLGNDTDVDGGAAATIAAVTDPANGSVALTGGLTGAHTGLTYQPDLNYCGGPDTFTYTISGGSTATVSVTVTCVNDAPTLDLDANNSSGASGTGFNASYTGGGIPIVDTDVTIADVDNTTLDSATIIVPNPIVGETLTISGALPVGIVAGAYNPGTGTLILGTPVTNATLADFQAAIRQVIYTHPSPGGAPPRTLSVVVNDGTDGSNTATTTVTFNTPPTITTLPTTRQQGSDAINSAVATVADIESGNGAVVVTVNGGAFATVNGVTVNNIANNNGSITANVVASCTATNANFTLRATDTGGLFTDATLNVTVAPNTPPTLAYNNPAALAFGQSGVVVNPAAGPADNGAVASTVLHSAGTYTGGVAVAPNGVVTLTGPAAPVGTHTITVRSTDNCGAVADSTFQVTVNKAATSTTVSSSPSPSTYGQPVTLSASVVSNPPGAGVPAGSVTFRDGGADCATGTALGTVALNGSGQASLPLSNLTAGAHTIRACYGGSANHLASAGTTGHTVDKAVLTVTASSHTVTYGGAAPAVTPAIAGFVLNETTANLTTQPTCTTAYAPGSSVSGSPYTTSCSGAAAANYTFNYVNGTVAVDKAPLTVTASSHTVTYGEAVPAVTPGFAGFVLGENSAVLTTQPACTTTYTQGSPVAGSPYTTSCSGAASGNYAFSYVNGSVTVNKAPLTVTADNQSRVYGQPNPALTASITGFVLNQTLATSGVTGSPALATAATQFSPPGQYAITAAAGTLASPNYSFTFAPGTLTIGQAATSIAITNAPALASAPTNVGQAYTVQFAVTPVAPGSGAPTGVVTVSDGTGAECTATLAADSSGVGSCDLTSTTAGDKSLSVSYAGDVNFTASAAAAGVPHRVVIAISGTLRQFIAGGGPDTAMSGVTVALEIDGAPADSAVTDESGGYVFALLTNGANVRITPSRPGKLFDPISRAYSSVTNNIAAADFVAYDRDGPNFNPREVRVVAATTVPGQPVAVPVAVASLGDETSFNFSLTFDPALLAAPSSIACGGGFAGCTVAPFDIATPGRVGISVTRAAPLAAGVRELIRITFPTHVNTASTVGIGFADAPTARSLVNAEGNPIPALYRNGAVTFTSTPAPTFSIGGKVLTPEGAGLRNAQVRLVLADGSARYATTSSFGVYTFANVPAGLHTLTVVSRRYRFAPRAVTVDGDLANLDMVGLQ